MSNDTRLFPTLFSSCFWWYGWMGGGSVGWSERNHPYRALIILPAFLWSMCLRRPVTNVGFFFCFDIPDSKGNISMVVWIIKRVSFIIFFTFDLKGQTLVLSENKYSEKWWLPIWNGMKVVGICFVWMYTDFLEPKLVLVFFVIK